jgi:serine/threonine protein kinase
MQTVSAAAKEDASLESVVGRVADEFLRQQRQGERPDVEEYAACYPEAAPLLRNVLASLQLIDLSAEGKAAGPDAGAGEETGTLGDFRIVREVGRGGMGVVYEAVQISLNRRVALKVLPFAATMDARHLQRFKNEAQAAASLEHPGIVPVYAVGQERGVHYYAMKFIDGRTLAEVLAGPRPDPAAPSPAEPTTAYTPHPSAETTAVAAATEPAPPQAVPSRTVAEWGAAAAEALEHAHALGVVHRDVKPGNLMLDAQGKLWVTDFGLARFGADSGLTLTGDLVGTLRYMSPEQALARHGLVDHRTDVYALGATLYELLAGRPAVEGQDRQEILRKIAFEEPAPPRTSNNAIPADLETIVLKALAKEPAERYGTAQELADDLRCWLGDRPIRARRPTLPQRLSKLARRHRAVVWAAGLGLVIAVVALAASAVWAWHKSEETRVAWAAEAQKRQEADDNAQAARELVAQVDAQRQKAEQHLRRASRLTEAGAPSEKYWREAVEHWEQVVADYPGEADYRRQLFRCWNGLAKTLAAMHRYKDAAEAVRREIVVLLRAGADFPQAPVIRALCSNLYEQDYLLGLYSQRAGLLPEAEAAYLRNLEGEQKELEQSGDARHLRADDRVYLASTLNALGMVRTQAGKLREAEADYRKALALLEPAQKAPGIEPILPAPARAHHGLGDVFTAAGQAQKAEQAYHRALECYQQATAAGPPYSADSWQQLAWFLATCPDTRFRDPRRAVEAARKAVELALDGKAGDLAQCEKTLGLAYYRAGEWQAAVRPLEKCRSHAGQCDYPAAFLYVMAAWRLGKTADARRWYDLRIREMEQGLVQDVEVLPFRDEAAALLGIKDGAPKK